MLTFTGAAFAEAGPTAAPTATVLMTSAAAMATRVRVNCDCDDILISLFIGGRLTCRCTFLIKERANPGKLRKTKPRPPPWGFSQPKVGAKSQPSDGNIRHVRRVEPSKNLDRRLCDVG